MGPQDGLYVRSRQITNFQRKLFGGWVTSKLLHQRSLCSQNARDRFKEMDGDTDRPGLLGNGPVDRLPDPPGGIGTEFETAPRVEFAHCTQQTHVTFLNQVQEGDA